MGIPDYDSGKKIPGIMDSSPQSNGSADRQFRERFEHLLPTIQERWPELARHTLEATRGSLDEVVRLIEQRFQLQPVPETEEEKSSKQNAVKSGIRS